MSVRLFRAPDAFGDYTVWGDLGAGQPAPLLGRHHIEDTGEAGDALWAVIVEQIPTVEP